MQRASRRRGSASSGQAASERAQEERKREEAEAQRLAEERRQHETEAKRRKQTEVEARQRAEEDRRAREIATKLRADQERALAAAKAADNIVVAVDNFIASYPESGLAAEAKILRDAFVERDNVYNKTIVSGDPTMCEAFLERYPAENRPTTFAVCFVAFDRAPRLQWAARSHGRSLFFLWPLAWA